MDVAELIKWTWSVDDDDKQSLAERVAAVRANGDVEYLDWARREAESAVARDPDFEDQRGSVHVHAFPDDWLDRDVEAWSRETGYKLQAAYEDALLALAAGTAIGKGHRRVLAEPLLPELPGLAEALGLA